MITPIKSIFASETSNKLNLTDSQIANGIQYQGSVVSNQLNAIANRTDSMIDDLQRSVAFYNNQKQYKKNNLCKLLVKYNGDYGIVTLIWKNAKEGNSTPFVEKEGITTLNFNYDYTSNVPILSVDTDNVFKFELKKLLNSDYWDIIAMSDNFSKKAMYTFTKVYSHQFSIPQNETYNPYPLILKLNFSLKDCDLFFIGGTFSSPFFTKEFLSTLYNSKIRLVLGQRIYWNSSQIVIGGHIAFNYYERWNLEENTICLEVVWFGDRLTCYGLKM